MKSLGVTCHTDCTLFIHLTSDFTAKQLLRGLILRVSPGTETFVFICTEDMKSNSGSSSSESDREESDAEATKDRGEDERADGPREVHREDIVVPPGEMEDGPDGDEDSDARAGGRDSSGEEVHDTSDPAGSRDERGDYDTSGGRRGEETVDEEKREERERGENKKHNSGAST